MVFSHMAMYSNTLEGNMQYGNDPYCFTPSTLHILAPNTHIHTYRHTHAHTHTHKRTHMHTHTHTHTCIGTCIHVHVYYTNTVTGKTLN